MVVIKFYHIRILVKLGPLCISNLLEEISSLCHPVVFLYFFALIAEEGFLISPCYSLELCIQMGISLLFSFVFCFSSFHAKAMVFPMVMYGCESWTVKKAEG